MPARSDTFDRRDPQRFRVYAAERAVGFPRAPEFPSLAAVRAHVATVLATPVWRTLSDDTLAAGMPVVVRRGRRSHAYARVRALEAPVVVVPRDRWRRWTVLHELAHCARGPRTANHGPEFTASYLRLVRGCWDPALADRLAAAFVAHRVRVAPWGFDDTPLPVLPIPARHDRSDPGAAAEAAETAAAVAACLDVIRDVQARLAAVAASARDAATGAVTA